MHTHLVPHLSMSSTAAGILAQPSASYIISLCHAMPAESEFPSSESHALAHTYRTSAATASYLSRRRSYLCTQTWSLHLRMSCRAAGILTQPSQLDTESVSATPYPLNLSSRAVRATHSHTRMEQAQRHKLPLVAAQLLVHTNLVFTLENVL